MWSRLSKFRLEISVCAVVALMSLIGVWGSAVDSGDGAARGKLTRSALSAKQRGRQEELLNAFLDGDFEKQVIGNEAAPLSELFALADARRDEDLSGTTYFFRLPAQHSPEGPGCLIIRVSSDPLYVVDARVLRPEW